VIDKATIMYADLKPCFTDLEAVVVIIHPVPDVTLIKQSYALNCGVRDIYANEAHHPRFIA
jgi:hypothetical protein